MGKIVIIGFKLLNFQIGVLSDAESHTSSLRLRRTDVLFLGLKVQIVSGEIIQQFILEA